MGITLSGAIQVHYEAYSGYKAHWETVCMWEFNKDYPLMQELEEGNQRESCDNDWPDESKYSDCLQVFTPQELPTHNESYRYLALRAAVNSLAMRSEYSGIRILFWRN